MNFHEDFVIKSNPTGSNYVCNPPVTNTDIDTVFLVRPSVTDGPNEMGFVVPYTVALTAAGWTPCVGEGYEVLGGDFTAWRKGNKNYICTTDPVYYNKYVKATKICKMLNLLHKEDRIFMFKLVMEGHGLPSTQAIAAPPASDIYDWMTTPITGGVEWVPTPTGWEVNPCSEVDLGTNE